MMQLRLPLPLLLLLVVAAWGSLASTAASQVATGIYRIEITQTSNGQSGAGTYVGDMNQPNGANVNGTVQARGQAALAGSSPGGATIGQNGAFKELWYKVDDPEFGWIDIKFNLYDDGTAEMFVNGQLWGTGTWKHTP